MPGLDGIGVARALAEQRPSPAVIFITAFDQFAVAAFEVEAVDYLMKPVEPARLQRALDRGRDYLERRETRPTERPAASPHLQEFWASDLTGLVRIAARDIDRVSAERDYMRLHVGRRSWLIHHSMAALEEGLDPGAVRPASPLGDRAQGFHHRLHPQSVGPLDRPARRRQRAAGRPALFRPRAEHRRPLNRPPRSFRDARRFDPASAGSDDDRGGADDLHAGMAGAATAASYAGCASAIVARGNH